MKWKAKIVSKVRVSCAEWGRECQMNTVGFRGAEGRKTGGHQKEYGRQLRQARSHGGLRGSW